MLLALVNQRRDRPIVEVIEPSPFQRKPLLGQIRYWWRKIQPAIEPRFDSMPIRGLDIIYVVGHQRAHVSRDDFLRHQIIRRRTSPRWDQRQNQSRDGG